MAWGNAAGPGAKFTTYIEWRRTQEGEDSCYIQHKFSIYVTGNFGGTVLSRSWGGQVRLYGEGWYGDSGWIDDGWVKYGNTTTASCSAWYTGYSGTYYKSECSNSCCHVAPTWQPKAVTNARWSKTADNRVWIYWSNNKTTARPYTGIYVDRSVDGGDYTLLATVGGSDTSYEDTTKRPNHTYRYRVIPYNSAGTAASHCYTTSMTTAPTAPSAPTSASNSRVSDTQNKVTWTNNATTEAPYSNVYIERSTDGGSFAALATLSGSVTSYTDSNCSANHYYRYRVRAYNASGYSSYATTGYTYNTPAAPGKPAGSRTGDTSVSLSIPNTATTATATEIQRSTDQKTWTTIATTSGKATSYSDDPGGGTFYYRARNTRGSLASAWSSASSAVVTICAPAAPTLTSPTGGFVMELSTSTVTFQWEHNPIDGSAQTSAQVQYSTDGGTNWTTLTATTAQSVSVSNPFALNATVTWRVRTKGVHADYSPWSGTSVFYVRQPPQLAFSSPTSPIENVPVEVSVQYVDASGSLAAMSLSVEEEGSEVYTAEMGTSTAHTIPRGSWTPAGGSSCRITVTARSTSGLQSVARLSLVVEYVLPKRTSLRVEPDLDRGFAEIKCVVDQNDTGEDVDSISVWRVTKAGEVLLGSGFSDGQTIEDKYAPLNREYSYRVAAYSAAGASRSSDHPGSVKTPYCFIYAGDVIARAMFDPTEPRSLKRANRTLVRYVGRKYPVLYDAEGIDETRTYTAHVIGADEIEAFEQAMGYGRVVFKSVAGDVFHAAIDVDITPALTLPNDHADVSVEITRVDGDAL